MTPEQRLAEIEAIFASLHRQPVLSDACKGERWVWEFGDEVATIKVIGA
jgi:hypothetical protein